MNRKEHSTAWCSIAALAFVAATSSANAQDSFGEATRQGTSQGQQTRGQPPPAGAPSARPQQRSGSQPQAGGGQPGFGTALGAGSGNVEQLSAAERQDYGVPPSAQLHAGEMHGPTPASIPGGHVITTQGVVELMRGGIEAWTQAGMPVQRVR
jgi:hypothetical protein